MSKWTVASDLWSRGWQKSQSSKTVAQPAIPTLVLVGQGSIWKGCRKPVCHGTVGPLFRHWLTHTSTLLSVPDTAFRTSTDQQTTLSSIENTNVHGWSRVLVTQIRGILQIALCVSTPRTVQLLSLCLLSKCSDEAHRLNTHNSTRSCTTVPSPFVVGYCRCRVWL